MPIRITGLNSGLDTEAIISALVSSYNYKTDKYKKAQTKLSWKQDAWKALNTKIYSLYTSVGNLRFSSAYTMKTATVSDTTKMTVSAGSSSVNGSYSVQITSLAKSGYLTGAELDKSVKSSSKLSDLGYTGGEGKIGVTIGGKTTDITISADSTVQSVVNKLKDAGVNASYDENNHRFYVSAKESGVENDFSLTGSNESGLAALTALGINYQSTATTEQYEALAQYSTMTADEMKALVAEKQAAQDENAALKKTNAYITNAINYANALDSVNTVGNGKDADDFSLLKSLAAKSSLKDSYVDDAGNIYTKNSDGKYETVKEMTGGSYDETTGTYTATDGTTYTDGTYTDGVYYAKTVVEDTTGLTSASDKYNELAKDFGLITETTDDEGKTTEDKTALTAFKKNLALIASATSDTAVYSDEQKDLFAQATAAVEAGIAADFTSQCQNDIDANKQTMSDNEDLIADNEMLSAGMTDEQIDAFKEKADYAKQVVDGTVTPTYNTGATRVNGTDATIYVNGAEYTSTSNTFSINGLTITATGVTGDAYDPTEASAVTTTVNTDTQGIYDKIKDFLSQYNALINEMTSLYNADSAKGYEPLTDEEKDAMSDTEVEKWEEKIKSALLRRDGTLDSVSNAMVNAMTKGVTIDGKSYYLSSFGIKTLGYLNAPENEQYAYHIDGDEDDSATSGNADKLMAAIAEDPDVVLEFMQGMANNLYDAVDAKMRSTALRTTYTVYNDKEMASEYSDYTDLITKWEEKLTAKEDYYYNKFSQMETALSKLNSQTSSLTGLFG